MKHIFTLLLTIFALTGFSQTIDFNLLPGTWLCYKATLPGGKDFTENYAQCYRTFKSDVTYLEERRYYYNTTKGTYVLDKKNKKLSFKNLIITTKFPNAKVKMDDLVQKDEWHQDEIIVSLDKDTLVILCKKTPESELPADATVYYRRQK